MGPGTLKIDVRRPVSFYMRDLAGAARVEGWIVAGGGADVGSIERVEG
jgi:hypothetical protein